MARSQLRYPNTQYFGFQNPYNNPQMTTYFSDGYQVAGIGNLPPSAAQPGAGPVTNKTGMDYDIEEPGMQGPGDPIGPDTPQQEAPEQEPPEQSPVDTSQNQTGGDRSWAERMMGTFFDRLDKYESAEELLKKLQTLEPFYVKRAQLNQKMGLENLEAAGQTAFKYKYAPQMFMTAAASRAAYYPEMVRAASDSFTGLNLANAAKPRMSGYYRGIV